MVLILILLCFLLGSSSCHSFSRPPFISKVTVQSSPADKGFTTNPSLYSRKDLEALGGLHVRGNNQYATANFQLSETASVLVLAQGEGASYDITPSLIESFQNDCLEVFFDLKNDKNKSFDFGGDDRQYRIQWHFNTVDGQNFNLEGTEIQQSDPSPTQYLIEMKYPWKTLGYVFPEPGKEIGLDFDVIDNDSNTREAQLSWHSTSNFLWRDPSGYGTLILRERLSDPGPSFAECLKVKAPPTIDGLKEALWDQTPSYPFQHVILGSIDNASDLSANFRALWDEENLYLLVEITDDIKKYASFLFDEGRIEDEQGNTVWQMEIEKTVHAGGALKNRKQEDTLILTPGRYTLIYQSDESHSAGAWDDQPPLHPYTGIEIYRLPNPGK